MAELWNYQLNKPEEVPDEAVTKLIASGSHSFLQGTQVPVKTSFGAPASLSPEDAREAFASGNYVYETKEERSERLKEAAYGEGTKNNLIAAGLGALNTITLGGYDQALVKSGAVSAYELAQRKDRNPFATVSGELGAIAAQALIPGGGAMAEAGAAKFLAQAGKAVLGGPSIAGKLSKLTVEALENAPLLAKMAKGGLASKAAANAVKAGLGSAVEGAVYTTGQLISEEALGRVELNAENIAYGVGLGAVLGGAVGVGGSLVGSGLKAAKKVITKEAAPGWLKDFVDDYVELPLLQKVTSSKAERRALRKFGNKESAKQYVAKVLKEEGYGINEEELLSRIKIDKERVYNEKLDIEKLVDLEVKITPEKQIQVPEIKKRIEQEILSKMPSSPLSDPLRKEAFEHANRIITDYGDNISFSDAAKIRGELQSFAPKSDASPRAKMFREMADIWNEEAEKRIDPLLPKIGKSYVESYKKVKKDLSMLRTIEENVNKKVDKGNRNYLFDAGLGLSGATVGAVASGDEDKLQGIAAGAAIGLGAKQLSKAIFQHGVPAFAAIVADKTAKMSAIEKTISASRSHIGEAIKKSVSGGVTQQLSKLPIGNLKEEYNTKLADLENMAAQQRFLVEGLTHNTEGLQKIAPKMAMAVQQTAMKALDFLLQSAPKAPQEFGKITPAAGKWKPSDAKVMDWLRVHKTVMEPKTAMEDVANGTITRSQVSAIRAVYPELFAEITKQLIDEASHAKNDLTHKIRSILGLFIGPSATGFTPAEIAALQQTYQQQPQQSGVVKPTAGAIDKMKLGSRMQTETESLIGDKT